MAESVSLDQMWYPHHLFSHLTEGFTVWRQILHLTTTGCSLTCWLPAQLSMSYFFFSSIGAATPPIWYKVRVKVTIFPEAEAFWRCFTKYCVPQHDGGGGGDGPTTPPRNNLTQRIYSLQPPSPQPHAGCWLTWTWSLFYYAFKPPSKREVNKSLGSSEFTSILTLSPVSGSAVCSSTNIFIFFINRWSMWIFEASRKKYFRETLYSLWQYMNKDGNYKQLSHLIMW